MAADETSTFRDVFTEQPVPAPPAIAITTAPALAGGSGRSVPARRPAPAPARDNTGCLRTFSNDALNSRLTAPLPIHFALDSRGKPDSLQPLPWQSRLKIPLDQGANPIAVLNKGDRVVLHTEGQWYLFDTQGKSIAHGRVGGGHIAIDANDDLFYLADPDGFVEA